MRFIQLRPNKADRQTAVAAPNRQGNEVEARRDPRTRMVRGCELSKLPITRLTRDRGKSDWLQTARNMNTLVNGPVLRLIMPSGTLACCVTRRGSEKKTHMRTTRAAVR